MPTANSLPAASDIRASWMEHQILDHVKQALRVTLDWKTPAIGLPRKASSLQFTLNSFQTHLERLMNFEERDGYMVFVAEVNPNLEVRIKSLEDDHETFRHTLESLTPAIQDLAECDAQRFEEICAEVARLLDAVDRHDSEEIELLQEAMLYDAGGEG
ncbi:MAG: hemerythrin domain-containing protein [Myxococcales bacterium]|nr:hemerythrin domain-containing protein [Planctomycetales bacterium]MCA9621312.1 hemerythrin domain-containing protein [Myxococcales bacterium]